MTVIGFDTALPPHPNYAAAYAAGYGFAARYAGPGSGKLLTAAERDDIFAARLGIMPLSEGTATDVLDGRASGQSRARLSIAAWRALGLPVDGIITYAADTDITSTNIALAVDTFRGINDVHGTAATVGVYGDDQIIAELHRLGLATFFFKAAATGWDGGAALPSYVDCVQGPNGIDVAGADADKITAAAMPRAVWFRSRVEVTMIRYLFVNYPDAPAIAQGRVHCTDGVRYRIEPAGNSWRNLMIAAGAPPIVTVDGNTAGGSYAIAVGTLCGMLDHEDGATGPATASGPLSLSLSGSVSLSGSATPSSPAPTA